MNILVTGCAGPAGRALGEQLARSPHMVIGVDMAARLNPAFDVTGTVPAADDPAMLPKLRRLLKEHDVDVLIPTVSDELPLIASAASSLLTHASVVIGSSAAVAIAHDKYLTMAKLASMSVPVPRFGLPSDFASVEHALETLDGPLVVKPRVGRGGRGVAVVERPEDIQWETLDDSSILQQFAPGTEYAPMVFTPSALGGTSRVVTVRKDELKEGRVGNASAVTRVGDEAVASVALLATGALGLVGPADIDIRLLADGTPVVLEINARFGANSSSAPEILNAALVEHAPGAFSEAV